MLAEIGAIGIVVVAAVVFAALAVVYLVGRPRAR